MLKKRPVLIVCPKKYFAVFNEVKVKYRNFA